MTIAFSPVRRAWTTAGRSVAILRRGLFAALLGSGQSWFRNAETPLPMQSVFKAPLVAAALAQVDLGAWPLDSTLSLRPEDLSVPYSAIDGTRVAIAVLYSGATSPPAVREAVLAEVGRAVLASVR